MSNLEIERKWLVPGLPEGYRPRKHRRVETYYLHTGDDSEIRFYRRQKVVDGPSGEVLAPPKFFVTMKIGNGLVREEYQAAITEAEYNHLVALMPLGPIHKDWYSFPLNDGHEMEVNRVDDSWWYAEVEFANEQEAKDFALFPYLEDATEVTHDPAYSMKRYWQRTKGI